MFKKKVMCLCCVGVLAASIMVGCGDKKPASSGKADQTTNQETPKDYEGIVTPEPVNGITSDDFTVMINAGQALKSGDACQIIVLDPSMVPAKEVTLESSFASENSAIASVSGKGWLVVNADSKTKIYVTYKGVTKSFELDCTGSALDSAPALTLVTDNKPVSAEPTIAVPAEDPDGFSVKESSVTLTKGEVYKLNTTVSVGGASQTDYVFYCSSFDSRVASVSHDGVITANGCGTTEIYVAQGSNIKSVKVEVTAPVAGVAFSSRYLNVIKGTSEQITAYPVPYDATENATVTYYSSDTDIATVDGNGVVTGVKAGLCKITAQCGGKSSEISVAVSSKTSVDEITLENPTLVISEKDKNVKLAYSYKGPEELKPNFLSSDVSVLRVDSDGNISGVAPGSATVTASLGGKVAKCDVTVTKQYVVVLDPGHDSHHTGAAANGFREEILSLAVGQAAKKYLEDNYKNVDVILTREDGTCLAKQIGRCNTARVQIAQDNNADIFVSLHFNADETHGSMVLASQYHTVADDTQKFARLALDNLVALGLKDDGILLRKSENGTRDPEGNIMDYYSINKDGAVRNIPAVIIEHAYIDSKIDQKFFDTEAGINNLGKADAMAIADFLGLSKK